MWRLILSTATSSSENKVERKMERSTETWLLSNKRSTWDTEAHHGRSTTFQCSRDSKRMLHEKVSCRIGNTSDTTSCPTQGNQPAPRGRPAFRSQPWLFSLLGIQPRMIAALVKYRHCTRNRTVTSVIDAC